MDQALGIETNELKKVIGEVAVEFYAQAAPPAVAGRMARLQQAAWDEVLAGRHAGTAFADLRNCAQRLFNPDDLIDTCNHHILWALTPVVGASLACGPGEDRISLREIGAALAHMLAGAMASARTQRMAA
ncbi:MAG TPA: hypothetical protein PKA55_09110 [Rhodoblastus sp.]|nr:hypothetical protein [Rhodoblastus sp.]